MHFGGTMEYFRDTVFNYPTMAECYKVAAFDGLNKLNLDASDTASMSSAAEELLKNVNAVVESAAVRLDSQLVTNNPEVQFSTEVGHV